MTAFTSTQSGSWSDGRTWGGVSITDPSPIDGDTFTINHDVTGDIDIEVGTSGVAGTLIGLIDATSGKTGALTMAAGRRIRANGDVQLANAVLTLSAGAIYEFGNGGSGQGYKLLLSNAGSQTSTRIVANGTSGSRCKFQKESGAGNGYIQRYTNSTAVKGGITADYTDFSDLGAAGNSFGNWAIDLIPSGATQELHLNHCTLNNCGGITTAGLSIPADRNCNLQYLQINQPLNTGSNIDLWISCTAKTTGERFLRHIGAPLSYIVFGTNRDLFDIEDITCQKMSDQINTSVTSTIFKEILFAEPSTAPQIGYVGETISDVGVICGSNSSLVLVPSVTGASGTVTFSNWVFEQTTATEEPDTLQLQAFTGVTNQVVAFSRCLITLNARGQAGANMLSAHGSPTMHAAVDHCTYSTFENVSPTANGWYGVLVGHTFRGVTDLLKSHKSNLCWSPTLPASTGWDLLSYSTGSPVITSADEIFTADNTSTSTVVKCAARNWNTSAGFTLVNSGAKLVVLASGPGDPAVGESQTITSHTATDITVGSAFSFAPDSGSCQLRVVVPDIIYGTNCGYNALYNVNNGTCYDANGQNGTTKHGYHGLCLTDLSALGAHDIDLGVGVGITSAGPKFFAPNRGIHNFAMDYLGPAGILTTPSNWADNHGTYNVGDRVQNTNAAFYNNEAIWYRCILAHDPTSVANDEPGVGSAWKTYWRFDTIMALADACAAGSTMTDSTLGLTNASYPKLMLTWIRQGWTPTNEALRNLGHDGTTPGAVEMAAASGGAGAGRTLLLGL